MSSIIKCPHCNEEFTTEPLEEILNPTLTISKITSECSSWEEIAILIDAGQTYRLFNIGDSINCKLKDGSDIIIDIGGINLYGQGEVLFCIRDSFGNYEMNERSTNNGGFPNSKMLCHMDEILKSLPDNLQAVITPRHITQELCGGKYECDTKLWLPSIYEVYGEDMTEYACDVGERQIPLFKDPSKRIKFKIGGRYSDDWWLRSPSVNNANSFWNVGIYGSCAISDATNPGGVCPCFLISKRRVEIFVVE